MPSTAFNNISFIPMRFSFKEGNRSNWSKQRVSDTLVDKWVLSWIEYTLPWPEVKNVNGGEHWLTESHRYKWNIIESGARHNICLLKRHKFLYQISSSRKWKIQQKQETPDNYGQVNDVQLMTNRNTPHTLQ
jgi:hypothetical protein